MKLDWKFFLTLLITLVGVAVPVWLWQADQNSKSLSVQLITRIALQPKEQESIPGIEISVDGSRLEKPHLVVIVIQNNGSKPISATDFESPVQIRLESESSFVRASVTNQVPKDIEAILSTERQSVSLNPTLLNPRDEISITAITSGAPPIFNTKARIFGISNIVMEDSTTEKPNKIKLALLLLWSILSLIGYSLMTDVLFNTKGGHLRQRAAALIALITGVTGGIGLSTFFKEIGLHVEWYINMLLFIIIIIPSFFIASALNRSEK